MTPPEIVDFCASSFRTTPEAIRSRKSARNIGQARCAAVFVLREHRQVSKLPFARIGQLVAREPRTLWYWWRKANGMRRDNPNFRLATDALLAVVVCPPRKSGAEQDRAAS